MAEINLRAYISEIEDLVEHNQLDEAIAHCRHILGIYPKHLETYRLYGKALLEESRHSDAADIFDRVRSIAPDDFLAHVGMAIIREDETNLDGAIWHMERAFEVQSSHAVIQEELRRLYGRRDGLEPEKIQYTRGALARTYSRGGLYPQAIAELQAGLAEEPDRLDLKVLLAEALWRDNQRPEAAETCKSVLEKLPYCRQANLIMADILQASGQFDQAKFFRSRVEAVDPYEAHVQIPVDGDDAQSVPDHAVSVPKLQWSPGGEGERAAAGPEWMSALGITLEQPAPTSEVPDWLAEPAEAAPAAKEELPSDWLADLEAAAPVAASEPADTGWLRTLRAEAEHVDAGAPGRAATPEEAPAAAAPPADMGFQAPEWLRELESVEPSPQPAPRPAEEPLPDWLRADELTADEESAPAAFDAGLPDWMRPDEPAAEQPEAAAPATFEAADLPDWMQPEAAAEEYAAPPAEPAAALPDWMRVSDLEPGGGPAEAAPAEEAPADWLATGPAARAGADEPVEWVQPAVAPLSGPDEVPGWLAGALPSAEAVGGPPEEAPEEAPEAPAPAVQVPDWLKESLAAADETSDEGAPPEEKAPAESIAPAELPDWIRALAPEGDEAAAEETPAADLPPYLQEQQPGASDTIAGWLQRQTPEPAEAAPEDIPEWLQEALSSEAPTTPENQWLSDLAAQEKQHGPHAEEPERPAPFFGDTGPLGDFTAPSPHPFEAPAPPPEPERGPRLEFDRFEAEGGEAGEPTLGVEDETLAWLESLAAKHGTKDEEPAEEAEPLPQSKDMPDWLRSALEKRTGEEQEEDELELPAPSAEPSAEGIPDWLSPLPPAVQPAVPAEMPDWLTPEPEAEPETPSAAPPDLTEDEALAWLEALASQQSAEAPTAQALPAWLAEAPGAPAAPGVESPGQEPGAPSEAEEATSAALGGSEDEALAWLEALAAKHGVAEPGEGPPPVSPEQAQAPAEPPTEAPPPDALPAWLMETKFLKSVPEPEAEAPQPAPEPEEAAPEPAPAEAQPEPPAAWPAEAGEPAEAEEELPEAVPAEAVPDWLLAAAPKEEVSAGLEAEPAAEGDEALAWLESLAAKHGVPEEELILPPEARREEMPAWLEEAQPEAPAEVPDWLVSTKLLASTPQAAAEAPAEAPPEEVPQVSAAEALPEQPPEAPAEPEMPAAEVEEAMPAPEGADDEALAWLEALAAKHGAKDEELVMPAEARTEAMPAWLREQAPAEPEPPAPAPEAPAEPLPGWLAEVPAEAEEAVPAPEGADDEALAWLEALAARHGAKDEELVMPAEARTEEMPAWLREQAPAEPEAAFVAPEAEAPAEPAPEAMPEVTEPEEGPAWLHEQAPAEPEAAFVAPEAEAPAEAVPEAMPEPAEAEEVPAWLRDAMAAQAAEEAPSPVAEPPAEPGEPLPSWLAQAEAPAEAEWQPGEAAAPEPGPPAEPEAWPAEFWPPAPDEEARPMQLPTSAVERPVVAAEPVRVETPPAPAVEPEPKAARPRKRKRPAEPPATRLANARTWLQAGQSDDALSAYESLIKANQSLDDVVADLEAASERSSDRRLLRALGDAYMRQDRLQKALDTYRLALGGS